jgi:hypothetical protein
VSGADATGTDDLPGGRLRAVASRIVDRHWLSGAAAAGVGLVGGVTLAPVLILIILLVLIAVSSGRATLEFDESATARAAE